MSSNYGIIEYYGSNGTGNPCGYCRGVKPDNCDNGMWSHSLSTLNYQNLIDRGWRRSGKYCYKPILTKTCCPSYTIRCDSINFRLSKSQKKVLKRFNRFIINDERRKVTRNDRCHNELNVEMSDASVEPNLIDKSEISQYIGHDDIGDHKDTHIFLQNIIPSDKCTIKESKPIEKSDVKMQRKTKSKALRKEKKLKKIMEKHKCDEKSAQIIMDQELKRKNNVKTLEDYINEPENAIKSLHKLEIRFVCTSNDEYFSTLETGHSVYQKYQTSIHKDRPDECTLRQYKRFLIDNPFEPQPIQTSPSLPHSFGSFHQQYWLDGDKLIAVGVIDVLPHCVSSVYFYYDPEYEFLSFGTYSALRQLQQFLPELKYYYMGFYIHSCQKMRYKGKYFPSYLLCPEVFKWYHFDVCAPKLDVKKYCRFEENDSIVDDDGSQIKHNEIMILHQRRVMTYETYKRFSQLIQETDVSDDREVNEYASLVGRKCYKEILMYRS